ncbi:hypothetical protein HY469_00570 [Candidatus Roizmanbacteria bacterium]|nr:hypothetical protein [Candidatus Roizmanbacteria bacterium]
MVDPESNFSLPEEVRSKVLGVIQEADSFGKLVNGGLTILQEHGIVPCQMVQDTDVSAALGSWIEQRGDELTPDQLGLLAILLLPDGEDQEEKSFLDLLFGGPDSNDDL